MAFIALTETARGAKLAWLLRRLEQAGIPHKRSAFHNPVVLVEEEHLGATLDFWTEDIEALHNYDMEFNNDI